jgi:hypothetical protein
VDTIGREGQPGEQIQNVISVGMFSEGWDAKTVTHIMGLRAFTYQLLCEQVVSRGLRRTSYDVNEKTVLFEPEYVNIFGVPFTFLPREGSADAPPPPPATGKTIYGKRFVSKMLSPRNPYSTQNGTSAPPETCCPGTAVKRASTQSAPT